MNISEIDAILKALIEEQSEGTFVDNSKIIQFYQRKRVELLIEIKNKVRDILSGNNQRG